jgi:hypothetical protein
MTRESGLVADFATAAAEPGLAASDRGLVFRRDAATAQMRETSGTRS